MVIQGAVDPELTPLCLRSVRACLPDAQIILSTWEGTDVAKIAADTFVFSEDPGGHNQALQAFMMDNDSLRKTGFRLMNNVNRQIVSTQAGIQQADRKYVWKLRSDVIIQSVNFLHYYGIFDNDGQNPHKFIKNRLLICDLYTRNPRVANLAFHPSDWTMFGNREDVENYFDIPLLTEDDAKWLLSRPRKWLFMKEMVVRYTPEQSIFLGFLRKHTTIDYDVYNQINENNIDETELYFANNTVILDYGSMFAFNFVKFNPQVSVLRDNIYHFNDWLGLYEHYCLGIRSKKFKEMKKAAKERRLSKHLRESY